MEDFVWRFPLIGRNIFNKLDNQDLTKSKEISKFLCDFIENDRFIWERKLQKYCKNQVTFKQAWMSVTKMLPFEEMKQFTVTVEQFYTSRVVQASFQYSPLHVVAKWGNVLFFKQFAEKTGLVNPKIKDGSTPFHFLSQKGHIDICRFIMGHLDDKNRVGFI